MCYSVFVCLNFDIAWRYYCLINQSSLLFTRKDVKATTSYYIQRKIYFPIHLFRIWFAMNEKTRIEKDIVMFEENLQKLNNKTSKLYNNKIVELATQYYEDSKYYLEKKDYFTAFGCVNYGHGLLDAVLKF